MPTTAPPRKKRGRPRSASARARILAATIELLDDGDLPAVTMERIAARAGVGKPTLYRYWPNATEVAMTALIEAQPETQPRTTGDGPLDELRAQLRGLVDAFGTRKGRSAVMLIATADANTEVAKAFRNSVILKSRGDGRDILKRGIAAGEICGSADMEILLDCIYGPIFFRLLLGHQPLDDAFTDKLVSQVLRGTGAGA